MKTFLSARQANHPSPGVVMPACLCPMFGYPASVLSRSSERFPASGNGKLRYFLTVLLSVAFILVLSALSYSAEGHGESAQISTFSLDGSQFKLRIEPENYIKDRMPEIIIELTNRMNGEPVLDAELYISIEKKGGEQSHSGHSASLSNEAGFDDPGLDFGETTTSSNTGPVDLSEYVKFSPRQQAGSFSAQYHIHEKGEYSITLAVKSLGHKRFSEPVTYGFDLSYTDASEAQFYRMLFIMGIILFSGLTAVLIIRRRLELKVSPGQKAELLDIGWVKSAMESRWFQPAFQIPVFLGFVIIIIAGLFDIQQGDMNIATLLMWTIWWAAIIFTFVFVGRIWCMMCPFGAAQDWIGRIFSLGKRFPKPLRNIYLPSLLFFGLTWWDSYSGIVNKPGLTAWLLIGFFAVAVLTAFVYRGRTFCRYICPIGGLIGLYSMFSPVELRNRCAGTCRQHKTKECIRGTEKGSGCPMFETPMTLDRNNYCNFCGECVKTCSQNNVSIRFRAFAKDLWAPVRGFFDEAYLAMALVGISIVVTGEMVEPWHRWMDAIGKHLPFQALGILDHVAVEKATFSFVLAVGALLIPISLLFIAAVAVRKTTGPESPLGLKETAVRFAYMFIPVGLSMHLAHNVSHLFREGPGIIPAVKRAMNEHLNAGFAAPEWDVTPLMGQESIFWVQMFIFAILNVISLYAGYRVAFRFYGDRALNAFIPMALLALFFMALNTFILGQPMSLRHSH
jgi:hypothetical protein